MSCPRLLNLLLSSFLSLFFLAIASCFAQTTQTPPANSPPELLDHFAGQWVLQGTIAGKQTTHNVQADWVLKREYLRLHEVSREKDAKGDPAYEAMVLSVGIQKHRNTSACGSTLLPEEDCPLRDSPTERNREIRFHSFSPFRLRTQFATHLSMTALGTPGSGLLIMIREFAVDKP